MRESISIITVAAGAALLGACASVAANSADHRRVDLGEAISLRPHIVAVTRYGVGDERVRIELPAAGYVTVLAVSPDTGMLLLTSAAGEPSPVRTAAGAHDLQLRPAPVPLPHVRARAGLDPAPCATSTAAPVCPSGTHAQYLAHPYTVVVVTEEPISWDALAARLRDVSLIGTPREVLGRVATALANDGRWAASAVQSSGTPLTSPIPPSGR